MLDLPAWAHRAASLLLDVAVMLVLVAARLAGGLILVYGERSRLVGATSRFLRRVAVAAIYVVGVLFVLDNVGVSITPLLTTLGLAAWRRRSRSRTRWRTSSPGCTCRPTSRSTWATACASRT